MASVVSYVDGFNLYYGMKKKYGRRLHWLDVVALTERLRPLDEVVLVRYFTAIVKNEPAAAQRQEDYLTALHAMHGERLAVQLGRFKPRTISWCRRCRQPYRCVCGSDYRSWEEKETDVALGATMVADAALGFSGTTLLISADTDLAPAPRSVRLVAPRQRIFVALPPGNTGVSRHLTGDGDIGHFFIRQSALKNSQLPDSVLDPASGRIYYRPGKWS